MIDGDDMLETLSLMFLKIQEPNVTTRDKNSNNFQKVFKESEGLLTKVTQKLNEFQIVHCVSPTNKLWFMYLDI